MGKINDQRERENGPFGGIYVPVHNWTNLYLRGVKRKLFLAAEAVTLGGVDATLLLLLAEVEGWFSCKIILYSQFSSWIRMLHGTYMCLR